MNNTEISKQVKDWFFSKIKMENRGIDFHSNTGLIVRETEKAYLLSFSVCTLDGENDFDKNLWVPKSCCMTAEDIAAEAARKTAAFDRYDRLVAFAKEQGIKGIRSGLKTATIMKKLAKAGIEYKEA